MPYETVGSLMARPDEQYVHISKVGAGYVYRKGTDYRCKDCWKFIDQLEKCAELGFRDTVKPQGYCTLWSNGKTTYYKPTMDAYTKEQVGYGELANGTKCGRCKHFDGRDSCEIVEGKIDKDACCNNQEPR